MIKWVTHDHLGPIWYYSELGQVCISEIKANFLSFWHLYGLVFYLGTIAQFVEQDLKKR